MARQMNNRRWSQDQLFNRERDSARGNNGLSRIAEFQRKKDPFQLDEGSLMVQVKLGKHGILARVDTGMRTTVIGEGFAELVKDVGAFKRREPNLRERLGGVIYTFRSGRRAFVQLEIEARQRFKTDVTIGNTTAVGMELEVAKDSSEFLVIGLDVLERIGARIDFVNF